MLFRSNGVAASGEAVTLRIHHSLVKMPDAGYSPRYVDPRIGVSGPTVMDFSRAVNEDIFVRFAARHRLKKKNPGAARSEPVKPITYYVDPGIPEPIRTAVVEGTRWWNQAFEAAGYINAFRVEVLPPGADPDDIRYNMIHWTHTRTRGYSYGSSVVDPRTGEIIRGNVNLGSLRLQQDYLHGQGMVPPFNGGGDLNDGADGLADAPTYEYLASIADNGDALKLALDRVRQLSAHEVGHTLGFPHNYIGSAHGRMTVMDYPAPLVKITAQGTLDLSDAYPQKIGDYDKVAITWLYQDFPAGTNEPEALKKITEDALKQGITFMGYTNNNFIGAAHQFASVWDNGANLVDQLQVELKVREIGLSKFGPQVLRPGEPMSKLEFVLLPLYMHHRFQLRSAAQSLGGADYAYALRGDGQKPFTIVSGAEQRRALDVLLSTLAVDFTAIPERIVHARGSGAHGYFELTKSLSKYTTAKLFTETKTRTPVFTRFSTVAGGAGIVKLTNRGATAAHAALTLYDSATGAKLGVWSSPDLPAHGSLMVSATAIAAAAAPVVAPATASFTVTAGPGAVAVQVLSMPKAGGAATSFDNACTLKGEIGRAHV